ncbi:MAG: phosphatase PAP2 family protein [Chloroflexi bacterium]|nr:phosphatase PAP2 family protein [Chloroflexota bacterium]
MAFVMIALMALSRIYLGAHFPHDALVGFVIALLVLLGYVVWQRHYSKGFEKRILGQKLLLVMLVPIIYATIFGIIVLVKGEPDVTVPWAIYIPEAELAGMEGVATAVGMLLGAGIGLIFEGSRIRFRVDGKIWLRAMRYLFGLAVTLMLWAGLRVIFPEEPLWLGLIFACRALFYRGYVDYLFCPVDVCAH